MEVAPFFPKDSLLDTKSLIQFSKRIRKRGKTFNHLFLLVQRKFGEGLSVSRHFWAFGFVFPGNYSCRECARPQLF